MKCTYGCDIKVQKVNKIGLCACIADQYIFILFGTDNPTTIEDDLEVTTEPGNTEAHQAEMKDPPVE